jgi:hypothetical protein
MAHEPNAILAISSTDRFITTVGGRADQPIQNVLLGTYNSPLAIYLNQNVSSSDFLLSAPSALINGYIEKIVISQIQLQYNIPTVQPNRNDLLPITYSLGGGAVEIVLITIPYGFYSPDELAAMLQSRISAEFASFSLPSAWSVAYNQQSFGDYASTGFNFVSPPNITFYFPSPGQLGAAGLTSLQVTNVLKVYKMLGLNLLNNEGAGLRDDQFSWSSPDFLYTPFIDIYSDALTNYQALKDTDTSVSRRKGLLARIYLSGTGSPQGTSVSYFSDPNVGNLNRFVIQPSDALGSKPFVATYDLNSPKVIKWTPDTAVNSLDFQMRDCYGDFVFDPIQEYGNISGTPADIFNTEFQMTLLCIEGRR